MKLISPERVKAWRHYSAPDIVPAQLEDGRWAVIGYASTLALGAEVTVAGQYTQWSGAVSEILETGRGPDAVAVAVVPKPGCENGEMLLDRPIHGARPRPIQDSDGSVLHWGVIAPADFAEQSEIEVTTRSGRTYRFRPDSVYERGSRAVILVGERVRA